MGAAAKFVNIYVDEKTVAKIRHKLNAPYLFGPEFKLVLTEMAEAGRKRATTRAPVETGSARATIRSQVDSSRVPAWSRVRADGDPRGKGFRYTFALNASKKIRYHYRAGAKMGALTLRWFHGARTAMSAKLKARIPWLAARIEAKWRL